MSIQLADGTILPAESWRRIKRLVKEQVREQTNLPVKITSGGVTINVGNLTPKKNIKVKAETEYFNAIEGDYEGWTIRIWKEEEVFCVNYWKVDDDVRYKEYPCENIDENDVFYTIKTIIMKMGTNG